MSESKPYIGSKIISLPIVDSDTETLKEMNKQKWEKGMTKQEIKDYKKQARAWIGQQNLTIKENDDTIKALQSLIELYKKRIVLLKEETRYIKKAAQEHIRYCGFDK